MKYYPVLLTAPGKSGPTVKYRLYFTGLNVQYVTLTIYLFTLNSEKMINGLGISNSSWDTELTRIQGSAFARVLKVDSKFGIGEYPNMDSYEANVVVFCYPPQKLFFCHNSEFEFSSIFVEEVDYAPLRSRTERTTVPR